MTLSFLSVYEVSGYELSENLPSSLSNSLRVVQPEAKQLPVSQLV
ncbi:MAG: hypothetical protein EDM05_67675 [Leptolyngbya sp. IPPAS B-1204]|nr:hypothetical protein [Leptolyngbya sp. NK1-12]